MDSGITKMLYDITSRYINMWEINNSRYKGIYLQFFNKQIGFRASYYRYWNEPIAAWNSLLDSCGAGGSSCGGRIGYLKVSAIC